MSRIPVIKKATVKRQLNRKSDNSEDEKSIRDQHFNDCYENKKDDMSMNRNRMYRSSFEYAYLNENENLFNDLPNQKIRFPSFESTIDSNFHKILTNENYQMNNLLNQNFYNDFKFELESDAKQIISNSRVFSEGEKKTYWNLINHKTKGGIYLDRELSVQRYKIKKAKRKMVYKIRYKVRQDLAIKRLRNKGKFIKSKKMDIRTAANMILLGLIKRKRKKRKKRFKNA